MFENTISSKKKPNLELRSDSLESLYSTLTKTKRRYISELFKILIVLYSNTDRPIYINGRARRWLQVVINV